MFEDILSATIRGATPLLLAALGEVISQRAGVLNIGIEGMMLIGALFGMVGSFYTAEFVMFAPWFGLIVAGSQRTCCCGGGGRVRVVRN